MEHIFLVFVYLTLSLATRLVDDQPYCAVRYRRLCQGKGRHVGCQFPESGPGLSCRNYSPIRFHNDLKLFITHYINRRRQRIASGNERVRGGIHLPKPELMMMVEWDRELASLAQRLADQCSFVHDDCRATVRYPYAGQTVGEVRWRRSSESDALTAQRAIRRVFDAWWGERRRVQAHQLTSPFRLTAKGAVWGHFSQLAVWSLRAVGCGAVRHGSSYPRLLLVCDFSHTNMLGQPTLAPGPPAPCPVHTARRLRSHYPLLCAPVRHRLRSQQYDFEVDEEPPEQTDEDTEDDLMETTAVPLRNITRALVTTALPTETRPSRRNKLRASTKMTRPPAEEEAPLKSILFYKNTVVQKTTKGIFIDKLDHELEGRLKAQHKYIKFHDWQSRPTEATHQDNTEEYYTFPVKRKSFPTKKTTIVIDSGEGDLEASNQTVTTTSVEPSLIVRHKWQQTRDRPIRPGANALLNMPVTAHTRRSPVAAMMFDKEDIDQLFRDTGFNPSWMRQRT